jgi:hypothetical protein
MSILLWHIYSTMEMRRAARTRVPIHAPIYLDAVSPLACLIALCTFPSLQHALISQPNLASNQKIPTFANMVAMP